MIGREPDTRQVANDSGKQTVRDEHAAACACEHLREAVRCPSYEACKAQAAASYSEYERGYDDALGQVAELIGWGKLGIGQNQGGAWLYEDDGLGTRRVTGDRVRFLFAQEEDRRYGD